MNRSPRPFADDILLLERAGIGGLIGLAALLAWALGYVWTYGTDGLSMFMHLSRWSMLWPVMGGAGVACGFAIHLMRARRGS